MTRVQAEQTLRLPRIALTIAIVLLLIAGVFLLFQPADTQVQTFVPARTNIIGLMPAAFIAGVLSFLSPCTLPILPAYFAFTFGEGTSPGEQRAAGSRRRALLSSLLFFAGLATTFIIVSASLTAIGQLVGRNREQLQIVGGAVIIGFGLMSLLGKGFSGMRIERRRSATLVGAYLYGMTFALGWTACVGPTLGTIITLLLTQGSSMVAGAFLGFIYVLGLGIPLMLVSTFFSKLGQGSRAWRYLRGKGWEVRMAGRTLYLHSTSVISGLLMILIGVLLVTNQLGFLNRYATSGPGEWAIRLEEQITSFLRGY